MGSKVYTTRIWFVGDIGDASIEFDTVLDSADAKDDILGRLASEGFRRFPRAERVYVTVTVG